MTHCCPFPSLPPPPSQIAAEGRGTPPCRPGFSEDVYEVVVPDITEKGQPLFNGEWRNIPNTPSCWMLVMSVCVCVSVSVCISVVRACLHVLHFREDQNKPDIFKQLASVQLCGIANRVVCLVKLLQCGSTLCSSCPFCLHLGVFFSCKADTNISRLLLKC